MLYVLAFYAVYSFVRNKGVETDSDGPARRHALQVIGLERRLGSFHEAAIQRRFLRWPDFIEFWNVYYGTAHFVVTVVALVYLFRRMGGRYPLWRNTLACTTALALLGFAFYPLMPPRLLPARFGFIDTLKVVGGLWSFDSGAVAKVSNQYAAMPSLHFAWSSWCAFVLFPALRRPWARLLMAAYPFVTLFAIVVTANHFWLDAVGGAATLGAGFVLGRAVTRLLAPRGRQPDPDGEAASSVAPEDSTAAADGDPDEPAGVDDEPEPEGGAAPEIEPGSRPEEPWEAGSGVGRDDRSQPPASGKTGAMPDDQRPNDLQVLSELECRALLGDRHFGRLGFVADGWPVILPVNFVLDESSIVVRTGPGAKLEEMPLTMVAFEVDEADVGGAWGWSVLAQGPASDISDAIDKHSGALRQLPDEPSAPGDEPNWLGITIRRISGRRFGEVPPRS